MKKSTPVIWHEIKKVGMPTKEDRTMTVGRDELERTFLIRGEYSITAACAFPDGSGFELDEYCYDIPQAWAIIDGF